jgi:thiol-disulfide isomerase/thioredoxin
MLGCLAAGINGAHAANGADAPAPGVLRWTNGESIEGDFVEATGSTATWKAPLFEEPVVLGWNAIHRVDWPSAAVPANDSFIFSLKDGSAIHGDLVSITGSSVFVHSSRCGDVELKRPEVLSARRMKGSELLFAGPTGDSGWQPWSGDNGAGNFGASINLFNGGGRIIARGGALVAAFQRLEDHLARGTDTVPPLKVGPGGVLQLPYWNRGALLFVSLPDAVDIEFHIHSSARPQFLISLGAKPASSMRIETWDNQVVAAIGSDFKKIEDLPDSATDFALRLCWDRKSRHCAVFTADGHPLADWQAPASGDAPSLGLLLQNKGRDLTLDYLRIGSWNGTPPPQVDLSKPRLEMADGGIIPGEVASLTGTTVQLTGTGDELGRTFALNDVESIVFSTDQPITNGAEGTLSYADGTYIGGTLSAIKDGSATLDTTFAAEPLVAHMDSMRQLLVNAPAPADAPPVPALADMDTLNMGKSSYHGSLAATGDGNPRWLPFGAMAPVTPSQAIPYEIVRSFPQDTPVTGSPALFYMRGGDVLPGDLISMDRTGVELDSGITQVTKLPAADLEAIQFGASGRLELHGFADPSWSVPAGDEGRVMRGTDSLELEPGTSIAHAAAMQASEIRFSVDPSVFAAMRLRMFCAGTDPSKSTNLLIATGLNGGIVCGLEATDGQFQEPRFEARVSGMVAVRLVIRENAVDLYLNGACVQKYPIPASTRAGSGLVIEPASVWGNASQGVRLADFSTSSEPGCVWLPNVAADAKTQALTVPRFLRDDPPTHALIAANGDLLRGEVQAVTRSSFGFRAGLEDLTVPRDRVKAVIWLGKPGDSAAPAPDPRASAIERLQDKIPGWVMFGDSLLENFIVFLQNQAPDLKFQYSKRDGLEYKALQLGNETIASALDKVCAVYGMEYHVDDAGTVVIGPAGPKPGQMIEKVYWLKPGSLPADTPADKTLAAKGVPFPAGATAEWNADASELRVTNTPENQEQLERVLAADFGGVVGMPTHWLQLTSGARISLTAERFDKFVIIGHHPIYGRCIVPTSEVASIRNYPMEPSAAMRSVEDWHLVYAPEPVLPTAGGDSSAMIGKAAPTFSLPLLAGGQLDLSHERGKVVVLDFWATWCGPCVASMPELIDAMTVFPRDRVTFAGVDQDEPEDRVKQFLEIRGWKLNVALDISSDVGKQYGADSIPHTVIIGPDGKVAWVNTGYTPGGAADAAKEVAQLLAAPAAH